MPSKNTSKKIISYCGIACYLCPLFLGKCKKEDKCSSCKSKEVSPVYKCKIAECARKNKKEYCFSCKSFPCSLYDKGFHWNIEGDPVNWKPFGNAYVKMFKKARIKK